MRISGGSSIASIALKTRLLMPWFSIEPAGALLALVSDGAPYLYFPSHVPVGTPTTLPSLSTSGRFMEKVVSGVTTAYSM